MPAAQSCGWCTTRAIIIVAGLMLGAWTDRQVVKRQVLDDSTIIGGNEK